MVDRYSRPVPRTARPMASLPILAALLVLTTCGGDAPAGDQPAATTRGNALAGLLYEVVEEAVAGRSG